MPPPADFRSRSSTFLSDRGNRKHIVTDGRMTSGEVRKSGSKPRSVTASRYLSNMLASSAIPVTRPLKAIGVADQKSHKALISTSGAAEKQGIFTPIAGDCLTNIAPSLVSGVVMRRCEVTNNVWLSRPPMAGIVGACMGSCSQSTSAPEGAKQLRRPVETAADQ